MSDANSEDRIGSGGDAPLEPQQWVVPEVVPEPPAEEVKVPRPPRRRWTLPILLFVATCVSTYLVGGPRYAVALMTILVCHEAGHFLQAMRHGVRASLPFFIPVPIPPIGTLGAVIGMSSNIPSRRALFDIGITGPLAGLVPTIVFCIVGLQSSFVAPNIPGSQQFGDPLLLKLLFWLKFGALPDGCAVYIPAVGMAGWVGLLITSLNLFPIGQLDGGHILYALLRGKAHRVAALLLVGAVAAVVLLGYYWWFLMLCLLLLMGPKHPPTRRDDDALGTWRIVLGWLTLAFLPLGFAANPFALVPRPLGF